MKTSIKVGAALLLAGILIATTLPRKVRADQPILQPHQSVEAAILILTYSGDGAVVESATVTRNIDRVLPGTNGAEAIAHYKSMGMIIDFASPVAVIMSTPLRDQPATRTTPLVPNY